MCGGAQRFLLWEPRAVEFVKVKMVQDRARMLYYWKAEAYVKKEGFNSEEISVIICIISGSKTVYQRKFHPCFKIDPIPASLCVKHLNLHLCPIRRQVLLAPYHYWNHYQRPQKSQLPDRGYNVHGRSTQGTPYMLSYILYLPELLIFLLMPES